MIKIEISELKKQLNTLRPLFIKAALISFLIGLFSLSPVIYMRVVYGPVINSSSEINLLWITLVLLLSILVTGLLEVYRSQIMTIGSIKLGELLTERVFSACFKANLSGVPGANQGLSQLRQIRLFINSPAMVALLDAPVGIVFILLIFEIHPMMGLFSLLGAVLSAILSFWTERKVHPQMTEAQKFTGITQGFISSSGRNALVVESMGMQRAIKNIWLRNHNGFLFHQALASSSQATGSAATKFTMLVQGSALLGVGTYLTLIGHMSPEAAGALIIAKILGAKAIQPVMTMIHQWKQIAEARDAYDELEKFLKDTPAKRKLMSLPAPKGEISVENLAVRAPGTKVNVFTSVNFKLDVGSSLAIIGPSGSGKSSLARALVGVWPPLVGHVRLDGADIYQWNKDELGKYIGYLPQDIELFNGSLSENIARFGEIDDLQLNDSLNMIGLGELIKELPDGASTEIGDGGSILSGGQKQRVALARALYGESKLIILDEPNSSLDVEGDKKLHEVLNILKQEKRTVIFISHRPELIQLADYVLVMVNGAQQLFGPREEVMEKIAKSKIQAAV
jgi:ATP-binding cassette subfamily C exporter for protease/lipase